MVGRQQLLLGLDTGKRKYVAIVLKKKFHTEHRDYIDQSDSICMGSCAAARFAGSCVIRGIEIDTTPSDEIISIQNLSKKQVTLFYLKSACACKNKLLPNIDNK